MITTNKKHNIDKLIQVAAYILKELGSISDMHKLFKVMYFAEKDYLSKFGRMITGDNFIAMKYGPVPSLTFDIFKTVRGDSIFKVDYYSEIFDVKEYIITLLKDFEEYDEISEAELNSIDWSVNTYKNYNFDDLSDLSHDDAWKSTTRDDIIDVNAIAKAGDTDEETLKYIQVLNENNSLI
jgi:uncharacterized phage-associated protein